MPAAEYAVLLARAVPSLSLRAIEWEISKAKGMGLILAGCLTAGEAMTWPDRRLSVVGRYWERTKAWFARQGDRARN